MPNNTLNLAPVSDPELIKRLDAQLAAQQKEYPPLPRPSTGFIRNEATGETVTYPPSPQRPVSDQSEQPGQVLFPRNEPNAARAQLKSVLAPPPEKPPSFIRDEATGRTITYPPTPEAEETDTGRVTDPLIIAQLNKRLKHDAIIKRLEDERLPTNTLRLMAEDLFIGSEQEVNELRQAAREPPKAKKSTYPEETAEAWRRGGRSVNVPERIMGFGAWLGRNTPEQAVQMRDFERELEQKDPVEAGNMAGDLVLDTIRMLPPMLYGMKRGAITGLMAGLITRSPRVGRIAADIGALSWWTQQGIGTFYMNMFEESKKANVPFDPRIARPLALAGGTIYGLIDLLQVETLLRVPFAKGKTGAASLALKGKIAKQLVGRYLKRSALTAGAEISQETLQRIVEEETTTAYKLSTDISDLGDLPEEASRILKGAVEEFRGAAGPMTLISFVTGGLGLPVQAYSEKLADRREKAIARLAELQEKLRVLGEEQRARTEAEQVIHAAADAKEKSRLQNELRAVGEELQESAWTGGPEETLSAGNIEIRDKLVYYMMGEGFSEAKAEQIIMVLNPAERTMLVNLQPAELAQKLKLIGNIFANEKDAPEQAPQAPRREPTIVEQSLAPMPELSDEAEELAYKVGTGQQLDQQEVDALKALKPAERRLFTERTRVIAKEQGLPPPTSQPLTKPIGAEAGVISEPAEEDTAGYPTIKKRLTLARKSALDELTERYPIARAVLENGGVSPHGKYSGKGVIGRIFKEEDLEEWRAIPAIFRAKKGRGMSADQIASNLTNPISEEDLRKELISLHREYEAILEAKMEGIDKKAWKAAELELTKEEREQRKEDDYQQDEYLRALNNRIIAGETNLADWNEGDLAALEKEYGTRDFAKIREQLPAEPIPVSRMEERKAPVPEEVELKITSIEDALEKEKRDIIGLLGITEEELPRGEAFEEPGVEVPAKTEAVPFDRQRPLIPEEQMPFNLAGELEVPEAEQKRRQAAEEARIEKAKREKLEGMARELPFDTPTKALPEAEEGGELVDIAPPTRIPADVKEKMITGKLGTWLAGRFRGDLPTDAEASAEIEQHFGKKVAAQYSQQAIQEARKQIANKSWRVLIDAQIQPKETIRETEQKPVTQIQAQGEVRVGDNAARPEPPVAGAVGRSGDVEQRRPKIIGKTPLPQPRDHVRPDIYPPGALSDDQRHDANLALTRFFDQEGRGFMMGNAAGVGKTRVMLAVANEYFKRTKDKIMVIVPDLRVWKQWLKEAKTLGVDVSNFDVSTYNRVARQQKKSNSTNLDNTYEKNTTEEYGLIIYDEAHNLKNSQAQKTIQGTILSKKTKHVLFATATPMDRPVGAAYFLGEITGLTREAMGLRLGFRIAIMEVLQNGIKMPIEVAVTLAGHTWLTVQAEIQKMRHAAVNAFGFVRRAFDLYADTVEEKLPAMLGSDLAMQQAIINYYDQLEDAGLGRPANLRGQRTQAIYYWNEHLKLDAILTEALHILKTDKNRKVIVVLKSVKDVVRLQRPRDLEKAIIWDKTIGKIAPTNIKYPGGTTFMAEKLTAAGFKVAKIYGGTQESKMAETAKFQEDDNYRVAVMTAESGGTGIDLDDDTGKHPRTMLFVTVPFAGDIFEQTMFRISRRRTMSRGTIKFFSIPNSIADVNSQRILNAKLQTLKSIQEGKVDDIEDDEAITPGAENVETAEEQTDLERELDNGAQYEIELQDAEGRTPDFEAGEDDDWSQVGDEALHDKHPEHTKIKPLGMINLVTLVRELLGKVPDLKDTLRKAGARGMFSPKSGAIRLLRAIFDPLYGLHEQIEKEVIATQSKMKAQGIEVSAAEVRNQLRYKYFLLIGGKALQALKTLAHEIGHVWDFLPDAMLGRGNIFGHLGKLSDYRNKLFPILAPGHGETIELRIQYIESKLTGLTEARKELNKDAARYATTKAKSGTEKWKEHRARKYYELLLGLAAARGLIHINPLYKEMANLSHFWEPMVPDRRSQPEYDDKDQFVGIRLSDGSLVTTEDDDFLVYRLSPSELYANAISMLFNNPDLMEKRFPETFKLLIGDAEHPGWFLADPGLKEAYQAIQRTITEGNTLSDEIERMQTIWARQRIEEEKQELAKKKSILRNLWGGIRTIYGNKYHGTWTATKIALKAGVTLLREENPIKIIENWLYHGAQAELYRANVLNTMFRFMNEKKIGPDDMGIYLFYKRIAGQFISPLTDDERKEIEKGGDFVRLKLGDRYRLANPGGNTIEDAQEYFQKLKEESPQLFEDMEAARKIFWEGRLRYPIKMLVDSGAISDRLAATLTENEFYATFAVLFDDNNPVGAATQSHIYRQKGTFLDIGNPLDATIAKDLALIGWAQRQSMLHGVVRFFNTHGDLFSHLYQIEPLQFDHVPRKIGARTINVAIPKIVNNKDMGTIIYSDKGQLRGIYINKEVADAFNYATDDISVKQVLAVTDAMFSGLKQVFTSLRPGFILMNSLPLMLGRDFNNAVQSLYALGGAKGGPGLAKTISGLQRQWNRSIKPAWRRNFGILDETAQKMLEGNMLISIGDLSQWTDEAEANERYFIKIMGNPTRREQYFRQGMKMVGWLKMAAQTGETASKMAIYRFLTATYPDMSEEEKAEHVRVMGSPNFLFQGGGGTLGKVFRSPIMFWNPYKEDTKANFKYMAMSPLRWWFAMATVVVIPTTIRFSLKYGPLAAVAALIPVPMLFFGPGGADDPRRRWRIKLTNLHEMWKRIPDWKLVRYQTYPLPIGILPEGAKPDEWKVLTFSHAYAESQRFIAGVAWNLLKATKAKFDLLDAIGDLGSYMGGQLPTFNPWYVTASDFYQYFMVPNWSPRNWLTGREVFSYDIKMMSPYSLRKFGVFAGYLWNQLGGSLLTRYKYQPVRENLTLFEKFLRLPIINDSMARFFDFTKAGLEEPKRGEKHKKAVEKAEGRERLIDYWGEYRQSDQFGKMSFTDWARTEYEGEELNTVLKLAYEHKQKLKNLKSK